MILTLWFPNELTLLMEMLKSLNVRQVLEEGLFSLAVRSCRVAVVPFQTVKKRRHLDSVLCCLMCRCVFSSESVSDKEQQPADGVTIPKG